MLRSLAAALLLLAAPSAAFADPADDWKVCAATDADRAIVACTALIGGNLTAIDLADAFYNRGNAYYAKGAYDRAIVDYDSAIRSNPNYAAAFNNRGNAYNNKGDANRAIADYDAAIRLNPNDADSLYNRGNAYYAKGDPDRAIVDYEAAIRLNPNYAFAFVGRGNIYDDEGQHDRAIADYDAAIRLDPNLASAFYNRGVAYNATGNPDRAIIDYDAAIRLSPNYASAFVGRGNVYDDKGQHDRALGDYDAAIRLDPTFASAFYNRGIAYSAKGNPDRAIADYDDAIRLNPNYAHAFNGRGSAYTAKGDFARAISDYDTAIRIDPKFAQPWANRGIAEWRDGAGDGVAAISDIEHALSLNPNLAYARAKLEEIKNRRSAVLARGLPVIPGRRVALVIGNSAYDRLQKLPNAVGDADAVAKALGKSGYQVTYVHDLSTKDLKTAIDTFRDQTAPRSETALVWYVGHGESIQIREGARSTRGQSEMAAVKTDNFILGVDYAPGSDVGQTGVTVGELINAALPAGSLRVVIIDACRGEHPQATTDATRGGFAGTDKPRPPSEGITPDDQNLYVVYSTAPGMTASDGPEHGHSPFTQSFLRLVADGKMTRDVRIFFGLLKFDMVDMSRKQTIPEQVPQIYDPDFGLDDAPLAPANQPKQGAS
jgi:tetratricopeptide (TPR) repeat protein